MIQDVCSLPVTCEAQPAGTEEPRDGLFAGMLAELVEGTEAGGDTQVTPGTEVTGDGTEEAVAEESELFLDAGRFLPVTEAPVDEPVAEMPAETDEEQEEGPRPEAMAAPVASQVQASPDPAAEAEAEPELKAVAGGDTEAAPSETTVATEERPLVAKDKPEAAKVETSPGQESDKAEAATTAKAAEKPRAEDFSREEKGLNRRGGKEEMQQARPIGMKPEFKAGAVPKRDTGLTIGKAVMTESTAMPQNLPEGGFAPDLPEELPSRILEAVTERFRMHFVKREEKSEIRVMLRPESLGEVVIRLSDEDGRVSGRIFVENPVVKDLLESLLPQLRERLERLNINLQEMQVDLGANRDQGQGARTAARASFPAWPAPARRAMAAAAVPVVMPRGRLDIMA